MIERVPVEDVFAENCYFYIDPRTRQGFIIDPGAEADRLMHMIQRSGVDIRAILLTHGHFDHTGAVLDLHLRFGIPYYILAGAGQEYLTNPQLNLSQECGRYIVLQDARFFQDSDYIHVPANPAFGLHVIATPGHTPDSVTFYSQTDQAAFVGDTIFAGSPGSTQFPGGDQRALAESIFNRIMNLPGDTTLYSGHTGPTTVNRERQLYR